MRKLLLATRIIPLVLAACGAIHTREGQEPSLQENLHLTPTESVKAMVEAVRNILTDPKLRRSAIQERRAEIRKALAQRFSLDEMARRSLAIHWRDRSPQERQEFVTCFTDFVEDFYLFTLEDFSHERIVYLGEQIEQDMATVRTKIVTAASGEIPIDYRLIRRADTWQVYDVIIEGESLISNYRSQFNKVIRAASYPELARLVCLGTSLRAEELLKRDPGEPIMGFAKRTLPPNAKLLHEVVVGEFGPPGKNIVILFEPEGCRGSHWTGWVLLPVQRATGLYQRLELPPMKEIKGRSTIEVEAVLLANAHQDPERKLIVFYHYYRTGSRTNEGNAAYVYEWDGKGFRILESLSRKLVGLKSAAELRPKLGAISNR